MSVDFPSRCMHVRHLRIEYRLRDFRRDPELLMCLGVVVDNCINLRTLVIQSRNFIHFAQLSPEFQDGFCSGERDGLKTLNLRMDPYVPDPYASTDILDVHIQEMDLPGLTELHYHGDTLFPSLVGQFHQTIQRLYLTSTSLSCSADDTSWQPCPHVTELVLRQFPWFDLNLPWLVRMFPNVKVLKLYSDGEMDLDRDDNRSRNLTCEGWQSLDKLVGDLYYVYGLGLTCEVRELVISSPFSLRDSSEFIDIMSQMRIGSLNMTVSLATIDVWDFFVSMERCNFSDISRIEAQWNIYELDESELVSVVEIEYDDTVPPVSMESVSDEMMTFVKSIERRFSQATGNTWEWTLMEGKNSEDDISLRLIGERTVRTKNGGPVEVVLPTTGELPGDRKEEVYWSYRDGVLISESLNE
ncbi:hypothetical protein K474DRAFT_1704207 [Panus rudis PR-1116 ss-1]|nr:hypothetical protein K474DRAFT_1704207 [Panus rudis PR-1116 ss-1]